MVSCNPQLSVEGDEYVCGWDETDSFCTGHHCEVCSISICSSDCGDEYCARTRASADREATICMLCKHPLEEGEEFSQDAYDWFKDGKRIEWSYGEFSYPEESFSAEGKTRTFVVSSVDYDTGQIDDLDLPQDFTLTLDIDEIGDTTDMQEIADYLVEDISDEVEIVAPIVPVDLHYSLGDLFLDKGKHIYLTKPFTKNYEQAQKLINKANQSRDKL